MMAARPHRPTRLEWLLPTALAAVVLSRFSPLAAPAGLVLLCYLPGLYALRATSVAHALGAGGQRIAALAVSLAVMPVLLNPIWHLTNAWPALLAAAWLALMALLLLRQLSGSRAPTAEDLAMPETSGSRTAGCVAGAVAVYLMLVTILPYWPTELSGAPIPAAIHDFIKHHAVLLSLERRPLPLGNPFFADELDGPVYYYHYFYLAPATLRTFAPALSIELAFGLHSALVAIATTGMVFVLVRRLSGSARAAAMGALLTALVGGFDIVPLLLRRQPTITLDAWADHLIRTHSLLNQMIWSPQNMLGVLILLIGVYLLSAAGTQRSWLIWGPVLAAALIGTSVWVAFPVLLALPAFVGVELWRERGEPARAIKQLLGAASVAGLTLALSAPTLLGYAEMSRRHGRGLTAAWPHHENAILGKAVPPGPLANLLDLPWVLLIDLGPLLVLPILAGGRVWRRAWQDRGGRLLIIAGLVSLAGFAVLRSDFEYNDFGQKSMLVALIASAVLSGMAFADWPIRRRAVRAVAVAAVLLGLPVSLYEAPLTAVRRHVDPKGPLAFLAPDDAELIAAEAGAYRFIRHHLPEGAVVQGWWDAPRLKLVQIARRPLGVTVLERDTRVFIGRDPATRQRALEEVSKALTQATPVASVYETLRAHHVTHVFVGSVERSSWPALGTFADARYFEPIYDDDDVTVYALK